MLKVALTHDVDRVSKSYQYVTHPLKNLFNLQFKGILNNLKSLKSRKPYWNFEDILVWYTEICCHDRVKID